MQKTDTKRLAIARTLADHLVSQGLKGASLRAMAKAAGTSDRMLLHYFANKDELMVAVLNVVADRLGGFFADAQAEPKPLGELVAYLSGVVMNPQVRPYMRLWLELAASASSGEGVYRDVAKAIFDRYTAWVASQLKVSREEDRKHQAAVAIAMAEGFVLLDAAGATDIIADALAGVAARAGR